MNLEKTFNDIEEMVDSYLNLKIYQVIFFLDQSTVDLIFLRIRPQYIMTCTSVWYNYPDLSTVNQLWDQSQYVFLILWSLKTTQNWQMELILLNQITIIFKLTDLFI